jgi:trehalose 6-phosphate phosphatase
MTPPRRETPHLFAEWGGITRLVQKNKHLVVFLDFDGTLVRIAPMPDAVHLEEETRHVLEKLSRHRNVTLAIISGRQRAELQQYIGVRNVNYMGLYGWESGANKKISYPVRVALARTLVQLLAELADYPGVWIEPKRNSFSVHLKGASRETQRLMFQQVRKQVQPVRDTLQVMKNLRDIEVAPLAIGDKGMAVRKFLDDPSLRGALPIYFGDDFSDEPGFAAAQKGIPVLVGKRRATRARFSVRGPAEVATALAKFEEMIR